MRGRLVEGRDAHGPRRIGGSGHHCGGVCALGAWATPYPLFSVAQVGCCSSSPGQSGTSTGPNWPVAGVLQPGNLPATPLLILSSLGIGCYSYQGPMSCNAPAVRGWVWTHFLKTPPHRQGFVFLTLSKLLRLGNLIFDPVRILTRPEEPLPF